MRLMRVIRWQGEKNFQRATGNPNMGREQVAGNKVSRIVTRMGHQDDAIPNNNIVICCYIRTMYS